ncbi:hypothetical protein Ancab_013074 [Ancistrocladus abbreviatus]
MAGLDEHKVSAGRMKAASWIKELRFGVQGRLRKMMKCIFIGKRLRVDDETVHSSESLATRDYSASGYCSRGLEADRKVNESNIEEAESSLRESGHLNYEEARALLGRLEYQRGNVEAALRVFEGIDVTAVRLNMAVSLARRSEANSRHSQSDAAAPPMSLHAISLLFEAIFLKAKSLQALGRFEEAAQSCQVILDTVEYAIPEGLPEKLATHSKLVETLSRAVELLPELWILAGSPNEAISSYRRALLYNWNLELETRSKLEKEFAIFLLYSGIDATAPTLRVQMEGSFIPRNNIEEAILLLLILMRRFVQKRTKWDPSILDHLAFALSISGDLRALAYQVEEFPAEIMPRKETSYMLALCYHAAGEDLVALNLLRNLINDRENINCTNELLLASKICSRQTDCSEEGINYAYCVLSKLEGTCQQLISNANCLLGTSLSAQSNLAASETKRILLQSKALEALETADKFGKGMDYNVVYHLALENAKQRKLDAALYYAKKLLRLEAGSGIQGWILLARILSAQKQHVDAEVIVNAALEQTGRWDQAELLRTKARLHIVQDQTKNAIQTYTHILAVLRVRRKSFGVEKMLLESREGHERKLEMETWHDLANVYTSLSQWQDAEICLSKSEGLSPHSASKWYSRGLLAQAKGLQNEALQAFAKALDNEPTHVPSLISMANTLTQLGRQSWPVARSCLREAIRVDRTNPSAWYNLGLLYESELGASAAEAVECFEAAALLQETAPIEPFS